MATPKPAAAPARGPSLTHLIDPKCFHPLPVYNPPQPFPLAPPADIANDIEGLYKMHFYRHAAEVAKKKILEISAESLKTSEEAQQLLFQLWIWRQTSLIMARLGTIGREEAKHLEELGSDRYRLPTTGECIVPWRLRLITIRVQAGGDSLAGIQKYYNLAREARAEIVRLRKKILAVKEDGENKEVLESQMKIWEKRLRNLGLFTSSMLLGIRDTKSALSLLISMHQDCEKLQDKHKEYKKFTPQVAFAVALVYLQIGDTISSREWFQRIQDNKFLQELGFGVCAIADADWESAESILKKVETASTEKEDMSQVSVNNNLAITKIYRGKLAEVSGWFFNSFQKLTI